MGGPEERTETGEIKTTGAKLGTGCSGGPGPWDDVRAVGGAEGGKMNTLTPGEKAARMEMYNKGMTDAEIAAKCFVCSSAIFMWRKRHGLVSRVRREGELADVHCERESVPGG